MRDELVVLAMASSSTRVFAADVNDHSFAFLSQGSENKGDVELHIYPIPSCKSPFPETGLIIRLHEFDVSVLSSATIQL
jgi:hypothetical protein